MMTQKNITAQNDYIELKVPANGYWTAAIASGAAAAANADFVIQVEGITGEFITIKIYDDVAGADAAKITGASKYAHRDIVGTQKVRCTRTDANAGNGSCGLSLVQRANNNN